MPVSLATFMAGVRYVESGSVEGNYRTVQPAVNGVRARGAYGFTNWADQAAAAGLPEARITDHRAQDRVAAVLFRRLNERYQNWDLVSLAWYANEKTADGVAKGGYSRTSQFRNRKVRGYIEGVKQAANAAVKDENVYQEPFDLAPQRAAELGDTQPNLPQGVGQGAPKASELLTQFMIGLSTKTAGGTRQNINDLAPLKLTQEQETMKAQEAEAGTQGAPEAKNLPEGAV